ncbi:MAG TPA: PDZ domain-containing protein [Candidatus Polarisedimenticolaceae bacterium]|nr:PDZ domain-containing protein [Candidatus Polarisedimenticolaceae bacterium]
MKRRERALRVLSIGGVLTLGALAGAVATADDEERRSKHEKGSVRIVIVDDDGTHHEESFEFDADHPQAFLGVELDEGPDGGARVGRVVADSAAERAGLREGDRIVAFDGRTIDRPWDLTREVLRARPGDVIEIEIDRDGRSETVDVELGERTHGAGRFVFGFDDLDEQIERLHESLDEFDFDFGSSDEFEHGRSWRRSRPVLGVELVSVTPELRRHLGAGDDEGVLVGKVLPGTPAERAGIAVGDLIVAVDGTVIDGPHALRAALREGAGRTIDVEVVREGNRVHLSAGLPEVEQEDASHPGRPRARPATHTAAERRA